MVRESMGLVIGILLFINLLNPLKAEDKKYTITGNIHFYGKGNIHIFLVNEKIFKNPLTGLQTIILAVDQSNFGNTRISFDFQGVRTGTYGIRCFQDTNGNGKLDRGLFGPSEPWGMSWNSERASRWPRFENITFQVDSDMYLNMELK